MRYNYHLKIEDRTLMLVQGIGCTIDTEELILNKVRVV